jgi:long-subunit fatty acid transport protein
MKKIPALITGSMLLMNTAFAGGILTNTNQSAQFARMLSRNASIDLDAVYFNPAGLTQLNNGFYFGLQNQTITQNRTITSEYPYLNPSPKEYKGKVSAPVFPTAFAVYKKDNWAFSAGFGPNGGGGSAKYDQGLPSFEKQIANLVPSLAGLSALGYSVSGYQANISFEGTSVFWGIQLGATYKINDILSVYAGARYMPSVNTYKGSIKDIGLTVNGTNQPAAPWLTGASTTIAGKATQLSGAATGMQPIIDRGGGSYTLAQLEGAHYIDAATRTAIEGGLTSLGKTQAQIDAMNLAQIQGTYAGGAAQLNGTASTLAVAASQLGDKAVDTKQTGAGITPVIGLDIHLDKLNIGLKYEHKTYMNLTNQTKVDDVNLFPNGAKTPGDVPAIVSAGIDYKLLDNLKISGSYTLYLDKNVNWGKNIYLQTRTIDKNYIELALGAEYWLTKNFALSAGYMNSNMGASQAYQSDFSYTNDSYTTGLGFQWNIGEKLSLDAGMMLSTYKDYRKTFDTSFDPNAQLIGHSYNETYGKDTFTFAIGLGYKIF